jgi:hypothetical protein
MSSLDRHRQKQDPDSRNDRLRKISDDDQTSQPTCDQPLRIVIAEEAGPEGNSQVFCGSCPILNWKLGQAQSGGSDISRGWAQKLRQARVTATR